jgi:bifunctional UDP-N-acetylglucosamine pyrophosphorylase/glucosamine-1-phosphate N-acetyltransferase
VRDGAGDVQSIVEDRDADAAQRALREVNTGILLAPTPGLLAWLSQLRNDNAQGEYYLTDIIGLARGQGVPVRAVVSRDPGEIQGVNSKAQLALVERIAQARQAAALLEAGATLADPARIEVRGSLRIDADVSIDVGCVFEGEVALGAGVRVGPYCVLRDTTVEAGAVLQAYTHCDGAHIGADAIVGPYARLRPGADLGDRVHVGNFVEVKASRLDEGAKANHLTYVGDAHIGARCNIGAGTIFANYDGVNKHRSRLGTDVHIGSNAVLVAPLSVGDGATVGAGSTVTREVPAGKLTVARARQATIDGWQRPRKKSPAGGSA